MICPAGHKAKQLVVESRRDDESVYRRRYCCFCNVKYVTKEVFTGGNSIPNAAKDMKLNNNKLFEDENGK